MPAIDEEGEAMKVTVFGAAGRTGRAVLEQGRGRGHELTAFVRHPSRLADTRVEVVAGDARDPDAVEQAVQGRDAVVSVLALMSAGAEPEYSDATRTVVEAAERTGVPRIVATANNDAFGDAEVTGGFAAHAREHRRNRETLKASGLAWTIVSAPWATDDPAKGSYEAVVDGKGPGKRIAVADLATSVLDALERDDWIEHIVGVSWPV